MACAAIARWAFDRPSVRTAILTYIIIVALIYHYLLAKLWNPQGWQLVADTIEHVVTPTGCCSCLRAR